MKHVGWVLLIVGGGAFLLDNMGMSSLIPGLATAGVPSAVWGGMGLVGLGLAMMFRRPRN